MLKRDLVAASAEGKFGIYAVENTDQAIALLTGCSAGAADADGVYPEGSVNQRVAARLAELTEIRQSFAAKHESGTHDLP